MIYPEPLQAGDKVAIVSPASAVLEEYVDGACEVLRQLGYEPVVGEHCKGVHGSYSGTIKERCSDLIGAFQDKEIKAILCSRGGYGVVQLLEYLPQELIAENPKWVIGFSDISALHAAMINAGVVSIHGSMAKHLTQKGVDNEVTQAMISIMKGNLPTYEMPAHKYNRKGEVTGRLMGGNLAVLHGLMDTEYDILSEGDILFIEDINEQVYAVERMLYNLRLNGVLPMLGGLIVGRFTDYRNPDRNGDSMEDMVHRMVEPYDFPVIFDFPCGHIDENMPLIEGAMVHLEVTEAMSSLKFLPEE